MKFNEDVGYEYLAELRRGGVEVRSVVVRQGGRVVFQHAAAPFVLDAPHPLYSVTKSFTSCAVGLLVHQGLIDLDKPWISWFPEYEPQVVDPRFRQVTVRHLLTMRMGQDAEPYVRGDDDWALGVVGKPLCCDPGTDFFYNSMCSHLLSMLVQRVSGQTEAEFLRTRLFEPLGIQRWWWEQDNRGHSTGGFGLHLSTPDMARFGQCVLDGGVWRGDGGTQEPVRVLPAEWLAQATRKQVETRPFYPAESTEDRNGYGYQFWMCAGGGYRCAGLWGQVCYMLPQENLVVAVSSSTGGSKFVLDPLYRVLKRHSESGEVPAEPGAVSTKSGEVLAKASELPTKPVEAPVKKDAPRAAASLVKKGTPQVAVPPNEANPLDEIPTPEGEPTSPLVEPKLLGRHVCLPNVGGFDAVTFEVVRTSEQHICHMCLERGDQHFDVAAGYRTWQKLSQSQRGIGELFPFATESSERMQRPVWVPSDVFASYAWMSPSRLQITTRQLDFTRRCNVTVDIDGKYAVCHISVQSMFCGVEPTIYILVAPLG